MRKRLLHILLVAILFLAGCQKSETPFNWQAFTEGLQNFGGPVQGPGNGAGTQPMQFPPNNQNQNNNSSYWQEKQARQEYNREYYKNLGIDYPYDW